MGHGACSSSEKLDKFDGSNYTGWVDKMKFLLLSLDVFYVLDPTLSPIPEDPVGEEKADVTVITDLEKKRKVDEDMCFKYIKNSLSDRLCELYALRSNNDPRLLWKALEANFKPTEHVKTKELIEQFLAFRLEDNGKRMMEQALELHDIVAKLKHNSVIIPEVVHTVALLTKLPPSWKMFTRRMMNYDVSLKVLLKQMHSFERARKAKGAHSITSCPTKPVKNNTKTTSHPGGGHGPLKTKQIGVKKQPNNFFKKTAPNRNVVCSTDAINAIDAQIDDLVALINLNMK